jgi:hypothetical protein
MGLAMRTGEFLNLNLPSMVWKPLVQEEPDRQDVEDVDLLAFRVLDDIKDLVSAAGAAFDANSEFTFTGTSADGQIRELVPRGESRRVLFADIPEFTALLLQAPIIESRAQCAAIRRGLASVVPFRLLSLFSWQELQAQVCGSQTIDIEFLKANTTTSVSSSVAQMFWNVVEKRFDQADRSQLLFFIWGRRRLPRDAAGFEHKLHLSSMSGDDRTFPVSHTCFFKLDLPSYSSEKVMEDRLRWASYNTDMIDGDGSMVSRAGLALQADPGGDEDEEKSLFQ